MKKFKIFHFFFVFFILFQSSHSDYIIINRQLDSICNSQTCPTHHGYCKADTCICYEGYLTTQTNSNKINCNYKQKNSLTGLLLETFGLIGFGHIYSGRYFIGILKIIIFYSIICFGTQFVIQFMKENTDSDAAYYIKIIISVICIGTPLVWHFLDLYNWACNKYLDGDGIPMVGW